MRSLTGKGLLVSHVLTSRMCGELSSCASIIYVSICSMIYSDVAKNHDMP